MTLTIRIPEKYGLKKILGYMTLTTLTFICHTQNIKRPPFI